MKIILGTFKDNADELAEFLGPRLGAKPEVGGGELNFEDDDVKKTLKARHVKTYVKRFLNKKGERSNYQVQVEGKQLRLIELEKNEEEKEKEEKKSSPKVEEKAPEKVAETEAEKEEEEKEEKLDAAEAGAAKEEEEARSVNKEEEKKEGALSAGAVKKQTKPRTKKKNIA